MTSFYKEVEPPLDIPDSCSEPGCPYHSYKRKLCYSHYEEQEAEHADNLYSERRDREFSERREREERESND